MRFVQYLLNHELLAIALVGVVWGTALYTSLNWSHIQQWWKRFTAHHRAMRQLRPSRKGLQEKPKRFAIRRPR